MELIEQIRNEAFADISKLTLSKDLSFGTYLDYHIKNEANYHFDFDVFLPSLGINLQRPFVWSLEQKQELIMSLILERYVPNFTMIQVHTDWGDSRFFEVIDGKQRINAITSFMQNEFPIQYDGKEYYYRDFQTDKGNSFYRGSVLGRLKVNMYYSYPDSVITDVQKVKIFQLINFTGVPQEKEHLDKLVNAIRN